MNNRPVSAKTRNTLIAFLTFAAGSIDALSFLTLGGVFASFMSGNTLILGVRIGMGDFALALHSMTAVLGYIAGVALAANIGNQSLLSQEIWPLATTKIIAVEFLLLVVFMIVGFIAGNTSSEVIYLLILLATVPMGMQSVGVRRLGIAGVTSTYVTGTWTSFIIGLVTLRRSHPSQRITKVKQDTVIQAVILIMYLLGAAIGGVMGIHFLLKAAVIPVSTIGFVLIVACIRIR